MHDDPHPRTTAAVLDTTMSYVDVGRGRPVVFLHGNPTWSYLWRNVVPAVEPYGRCLALDLVGMGHSGPNPAGSYRLADHYRYFEAWMDVAGATDGPVLVGHDWGSALAFLWARRHPEMVGGLVYLEAIVRPVTWDDWPESARRVFQGMRSEAGEEIVMHKNVFIERILPASVMRDLSGEEMDAYRRPFLEPGESRRPMLTWPREIPIEGEPADVVELVTDYGDWLARSDVPKLFINGEPGSILVGRQREFCRSWPNQREVTVAGTHFLQEDSPAEIGAAIAEFVQGL